MNKIVIFETRGNNAKRTKEVDNENGVILSKEIFNVSTSKELLDRLIRQYGEELMYVDCILNLDEYEELSATKSDFEIYDYLRSFHKEKSELVRPEEIPDMSHLSADELE